MTLGLSVSQLIVLDSISTIGKLQDMVCNRRIDIPQDKPNRERHGPPEGRMGELRGAQKAEMCSTCTVLGGLKSEAAHSHKSVKPEHTDMSVDSEGLTFPKDVVLSH